MAFLHYIKQKNFHTVAAVISLSTFSYIYGKHALWIEDYQQLFLQKKNNEWKPIPVPPIITFRFNEILDDFEFTSWNRKFISCFINKKIDPEFLGSTEYRRGFRIGYPEYYSCRLDSDECIKSTCGIMIDKKPIDWDSMDGQKLLESLKLSEKAQKYIVGMNVGFANTYYSTFRALIPGCLSLCVFHFGTLLYKKLNLAKRPFSVSILVYSAYLALSFTLWLFMDDSLYFLYNKSCEDRICGMNVGYIIGGIEYYQKLLKRNQVLRKLMKKGEKYFTVDGDIKGRWKTRGLAYTARLKLLQIRAEEWNMMEGLMQPPPVNPNPFPIH